MEMEKDQGELNFDKLDDIHEDEDEEIKEEPEKPIPSIDKNNIELHQNKMIIIKYAGEFSKELEPIFGDRLTLSNLDLLSAEQIKKLLEDIKVTVGSVNSGSMIPVAYYSMIDLTEKLGPSLGLKLNGLRLVLERNENLVRSLRELELQYGQYVYISVENRILLYTLQSIMHVNQINSKNDKLNNFLSEIVEPNIVEEFRDL